VELPNDWMDSAACHDIAGFTDEEPAEELKDVCAECDVKMMCRAYARVSSEWGLWGGETHNDRRRLVRAHGHSKVVKQALTTFNLLYQEWRRGRSA